MSTLEIGAAKVLLLCASLHRRKDRRFVAENNLGNICGVSPTFMESVDGDLIPKWKVSRLSGRPRPSNYGVRLTKQLALRSFLRTDHSHLLYFEDDAFVTSEFDEIFQAALTLETDLVFFGPLHEAAPTTLDSIWLRCSRPILNHALLFTRKGARKTLAVLRRPRKARSEQDIARAVDSGELDAVCPKVPVAFQRESLSDNDGFTGNLSLSAFDPFMLPDDLAILDATLDSAKLVLECGCGGSTLHIADRLQEKGRLVSIEHSREWFEETRVRLKERLLKADLHLCEPVPFRPGDEGFAMLPSQLDDYVSLPGTLLDKGSVDVMLIDGRQRIRCALASAGLLRSGGLLLFHDFWPRHRYRTCLNELLKHYEYLFESDSGGRQGEQGMAVFRRK